ncbi:hypothetical protein [Alkaliflexus imshenetskii]|uniref:hypothetical protein n=1 Tax=Alkaliflexus imshenetskii TaxID=286730 RepID=UPI0004B2AAC1|nr:hypothetical protein [Alkaliflexus imshenetskii]
MYSNDNGKSWVDLYNPILGAVRWKGVSVSGQTGVLHAISCGNGVFRGVWN